MASNLTPEQVKTMAEQVVYRTSTFDPATRLPLVVMNSTAFPNSPDDYTPELIGQFIERLPVMSYALLFFACGAPNTPSWSWISKMYTMLSRDTKKRVGKVYIVHESWWVRAVTEMFRGVISSKFKKKMVHISTLSELAMHIDITQINIPPAVYLYNLRMENRITVPKHYTPIFGVPLRRNGNRVIYPSMWEECCRYLKNTGVTTRSIFQLDETNEISMVLRDGYDRGQVLNLNNYGPHHAASIIKLYLQELPNPIMPVRYIPTPILNTVEYSAQVYQSFPYVTQKFLYDLIPIFIKVIENGSQTGHTTDTIALCMTPSFIGRYAAIEENMASAIQYTKNLIELWNEVEKHLSKEHTLASGSTDISTTNDPSKGSQNQSLHEPRTSNGIRKISNSSLSSSDSSSVSENSMDSNDTKIRTIGTHKSVSEECLSSPTPAMSSTLAMMPPPPPRLRKSALASISSSSLNENWPPRRRLFPSRTFSETIGRSTSEPRRSVSTQRGKVVAELAKLYEEKEAQTAHLSLDESKPT